MKVTKAVIAVAGLASRFLPATKSVPKQLITMVDRPIIQYLVEELAASGITDIIIVTGKDGHFFEHYFDDAFELEHKLEQAGKQKYLAEIKRLPSLAHFYFVRQKGPYGNGTPILCAAPLLGDEPFVFAFGDDLVKSEIPFTRQLLNVHEEYNCPVVGVQRVPHEEVSRYGIVELKPGTLELTGIVEKPKVEESPSDLAEFGRMILTREIVDILRNTPIGMGNELWAVDAITTYVKGGGKCLVQEVEGGEWYTTGDPLNHLKATVQFALDRQDLGGEFRKYLKGLTL